MLPLNRNIYRLLKRSPLLNAATLTKNNEFSVNTVYMKNKKNLKFESILKPVPVNYDSLDKNVGEELTGPLTKSNILYVFSKFSVIPEVHKLALENKLSEKLFKESLNDFRKYCVKTEILPIELHVVLYDIVQGNLNAADIFPYFLNHAKQMFPHIDCLDDLKKVGDLRSPPTWYPLARSMKRKIIFHAGPTNSGKTYHALERLINSKSGVYCGPLKLLVTEIYQKCNKAGTHCDLITGEERTYAINEDNPANHVSCTVEMVNLQKKYEVAVIDEVQLLRDVIRGWAWTRALLGIPAEEIHLCGEYGTLNLLQSLFATTNETIEVKKYNRLTELVVENSALGRIDNVQKGDCIVCFSKNDIYTISRMLEEHGIETAIIYGSLPPGAKLAQAAKFNDPNNSCKVMIATDAIGMGLNLHIRRIIFYSLLKPVTTEQGGKETKLISISSALQISGRAGRYNTEWETGYVTTYKPEDLPILKKFLKSDPEPITQAGLFPTCEQIELYSYHLPNATLSNLMDIFIELCTMDDSLYFMCNIEDFKYLADMIQDIKLPLKVRFIFCCAPINTKLVFVCNVLLKFASQFSKAEPITFDWLCQQINWSLRSPNTVSELVHLESVFDILDLYLWLSYRFSDIFPERHIIKDMQKELDKVIQHGIIRLTQIVRNNDAASFFDSDGNGDTSTNQHMFGKGTLTARLLKEGLLTKNMLDELKREWTIQRNPNNQRHLNMTERSDNQSFNNPIKHHKKPKS